MRDILLIGAAVALLVVGGLVHGSWTNRWHKPQALEEAVAGQILNRPLENGQPQLDFGRRLSGRVNQIEDDHAT